MRITAWRGLIANKGLSGAAPVLEGYGLSCEHDLSDSSKASVRGGKALTESKYSFLLEPYENGAPAPTLLQPEVPVSDASPFLLTSCSQERARARFL